MTDLTKQIADQLDERNRMMQEWLDLMEAWAQAAKKLVDKWEKER